MRTPEQKKLKDFIKQEFDFSHLKKSGVFPKEMKHTDYEGQAKIICKMFGLESVYDYAFIGIGVRCHISYVNPTPFTPFVEEIKPLMKVVSNDAKVIQIKTT